MDSLLPPVQGTGRCSEAMAASGALHGLELGAHRVYTFFLPLFCADSVTFVPCTQEAQKQAY